MLTLDNLGCNTAGPWLSSIPPSFPARWIQECSHRVLGRTVRWRLHTPMQLSKSARISIRTMPIAPIARSITSVHPHLAATTSEPLLKPMPGVSPTLVATPASDSLRRSQNAQSRASKMCGVGPQNASAHRRAPTVQPAHVAHDPDGELLDHVVQCPLVTPPHIAVETVRCNVEMIGNVAMPLAFCATMLLDLYVNCSSILLTDFALSLLYEPIAHQYARSLWPPPLGSDMPGTDLNEILRQVFHAVESVHVSCNTCMQFRRLEHQQNIPLLAASCMSPVFEQNRRWHPQLCTLLAEYVLSCEGLLR